MLLVMKSIFTKDSYIEGGGVGDDRRGEDDRDVDRGKNCDRDGSEDDGTGSDIDKEEFN